MNITVSTDLNVSDLSAPAGLLFPAPGAVVDVDFVNRRYWWGGAEKLEANFTTFVLNGSTFDAAGLNLATGIDVTVSLAGLGSFAPGTLAFAGRHTAPVGTRYFVSVDNNNVSERVVVQQSTTPTMLMQVSSGSILQASLAGSTPTAPIGVRHGVAISYDTNIFMGSYNGNVATQDVAGAIPVGLATLRIGKILTAGTEASGAVARVVLFPVAKTQAELNALARQIQVS